MPHTPASWTPSTLLEKRIIERLLGKPLVGNAFRGTLVEAMLAEVLEPEWRWCADGWGSYDFERKDGLGLEVKQSSATQNWHQQGDNPNRGRFDIAERTGRYESDGKWTARQCRFASIYVFAWHGVQDLGLADHREPEQWQFYVVDAAKLPLQKTLALSGVVTLASAVSINQVKREVERVRAC